MRGGLLTLLVACVSVAEGAAPDVKTLFPSGGQRGTSVTVTVGGNLGTAPVSVWCSRPELKIEPASEAGKFVVTIPADAAPGRCWLRWHNAEGASTQKPFVIGTLPEVTEKEPNNEPPKAQALESPRILVNGILEKNGEVDVFAVTLKKGETLVAWLDANNQIGSPMDGSLQILNPKGFVRVQNDDDHGLDPLAVYTAETDGVHFVRLFAFPAATNASVVLHGGPDYIYRLLLTTGPFVDFTFPLAQKADATEPVRLFGWNLPSEPAMATPAVLPGEPSARILMAPTVENSLSLPVVPHAVEVETAATAGLPGQKVAIPSTVTGTISARKQKDHYAFSGKKGERWAVRVEARTLGSPLDPALRILDAAGKTLQELDDSPKSGADPELVFAVPADGDYVAQIRDLYDDGGPRYYYRATIEPERPSVYVTVPADAFVLPADKPLEIPVTLERAAGFKADLELAVTGLPAGLKAAAVKSLAADGTAKMVKLVIERMAGEATAAPTGQPIRIVGRTLGTDAGAEATAEAPIAGQTAKSRDLWLTVVPNPAEVKKAP